MMSHIESSCRQKKKKKRISSLPPSNRQTAIIKNPSGLGGVWSTHEIIENRREKKKKPKQFKLNLTKRFKNYLNTCFEAKIKLRNDLMQSQVYQDLRKLYFKLNSNPKQNKVSFSA